MHVHIYIYIWKCMSTFIDMAVPRSFIYPRTNTRHRPLAKALTLDMAWHAAAWPGMGRMAWRTLSTWLKAMFEIP